MRIILLGEDISTGCYLLRIHLKQNRQIRFGQHNQGGALFLPKSEYLYIGSARGKKGASSLGHRLIRHTSRGKGSPPHIIQEELFNQLQNAGIKAKVPQDKKCHWHIDYLLENIQAEIIGIIILRSREDHEKRIAEELISLPETSIPAPGLGASDHPGRSHLLRLEAGPDWWKKLPQIMLEAAKPDDGMEKI